MHVNLPKDLTNLSALRFYCFSHMLTAFISFSVHGTSNVLQNLLIFLASKVQIMLFRDCLLIAFIV